MNEKLSSVSPYWGGNIYFEKSMRLNEREGREISMDLTNLFKAFFRGILWLPILLFKLFKKIWGKLRK